MWSQRIASYIDGMADNWPFIIGKKLNDICAWLFKLNLERNRDIFFDCIYLILSGFVEVMFLNFELVDRIRIKII